AEDGIRDFHVTGVQTCALPISSFVSGFEAVTGRGRFGVERLGWLPRRVTVGVVALVTVPRPVAGRRTGAAGGPSWRRGAECLARGCRAVGPGASGWGRWLHRDRTRRCVVGREGSSGALGIRGRRVAHLLIGDPFPSTLAAGTHESILPYPIRIRPGVSVRWDESHRE